MTQMRTIEQAIKYIKAQDEGNCLTKHALRQLVISHRLPSVRVGAKYLINLQTLESYLRGDIMPETIQEGTIRRLPERL